MFKSSNRRLIPAGLTVLLAMAAIPAAATAQLQGDCNQNGNVSIGEVVTCSNVFLGQPLDLCPECDQNANSSVSIGEVVGAGNCFSNSGAANCRMITPAASPTEEDTPTPTPEPADTATFTPEPADTFTPVPTDTFTPEPTDTFTPAPTSTATATEVPTDTPTPEPTAAPTEATPDTVTLDVKLLGAGGTDGNCRGVCGAGPDAGNPCIKGRNCQDAACEGRTCVGGPLDGTACTSPTQCTTCRANFNGTPDGSCGIIQSKALKVVIAVNGVCAPRVDPDIPCATDVECPLGRTCAIPGFQMAIDAVADADGIRQVVIDPDSFVLPPAPVPIGGFTACLSAGGPGVGFIDCDGGSDGIDVDLEVDHNTTPGHEGNGGGLPDDPDCDMSILTPAGTLDFPCLEGTNTCDGGDNDGMRCTTADDCPDSDICDPCAQQDPPPFGHDGICNSGVRSSVGGTFESGDLVVVLPLAILQLDPADFGPDNLPCTPDDTPAEPAAAVPVTLSTGLNVVRVFDGNNFANNDITPDKKCGFFDCISQTEGAPLSCQDVDATGDITGAIFGGGFPALDIEILGDISTTFSFEIGASQLVNP